MEAAGLQAMIADPPGRMVDERLVASLNHAVRRLLPGEMATRVLALAGERTGRYVLENRIPRLVRLLLKALPASLSHRLLLRAIAANAWTFAGSGRVETRGGLPAVIVISGNPLPGEGCPWHSAVFRTLFRELVSASATVAHGAGPQGQDIFTIGWRPALSPSLAKGSSARP